MNSSAYSKTQIPALLGLLAIIFMTSAQAQYCKWVDETGCVHYAEKCPPGVEAEKVEILEKPCPVDTEAAPPKMSAAGSKDEMADEVLQKAIQQSSFEPVTSSRQLAGCWERFQPPADVQPNPNKI